MNTALSIREDAGLMTQDEILSPVMSLQLAKQRLKEFQEFVKEYLREGEDYGTIPGTPKPTLYKPGADKLCELYGLSDAYDIVDKVEDFSLTPPLFDYTIKCTLTRIRTQLPVSTGLGSCNSYEGRYRWREGQRLCPQCGKAAIIKGKQEYGGGWVCFGKKGGCGAKFPDGDATIEKQNIGKVENDDIATLKNTILKMAKKRAKVDATLAATRSSGIFTQDVDEVEHDYSSEPPQQKKQSRAKPQVENVVCNSCGQTNGHAATCKYSATQQGQGKEAPVQDKPQDKPKNIDSEVLILDVAQRTAKKDKKPFLVIEAVDDQNHQGKIFVFHQSMFQYLIVAKDKKIVCELSSQTKDDKTFYQLEKIHELDGVKFVDGKPTKQAETTQEKADEEDF